MNQFPLSIVEDLVKDVFFFLVSELNREAKFNEKNNTLLYQLSFFLYKQIIILCQPHKKYSDSKKLSRTNAQNKYKGRVNTKSKPICIK